MNARWLILNKDGNPTILDGSVGPSLLVFTSKAAAQGYIDHDVAYEGWRPDDYRARPCEAEAGEGGGSSAHGFVDVLQRVEGKAIHFFLDPEPMSAANLPRSISKYLAAVTGGLSNPDEFAQEL